MHCSTSVLTPQEQREVDEAENKLLTDEERAAKMGITMERMHEMRAYTDHLRKKFPRFSEKRLTRKTAEYFKIKLV